MSLHVFVEDCCRQNGLDPPSARDVGSLASTGFWGLLEKDVLLANAEIINQLAAWCPLALAAQTDDRRIEVLKRLDPRDRKLKSHAVCPELPLVYRLLRFACGVDESKSSSQQRSTTCNTGDGAVEEGGGSGVASSRGGTTGRTLNRKQQKLLDRFRQAKKREGLIDALRGHQQAVMCLLDAYDRAVQALCRAVPKKSVLWDQLDCGRTKQVASDFETTASLSASEEQELQATLAALTQQFFRSKDVVQEEQIEDAVEDLRDISSYDAGADRRKISVPALHQDLRAIVRAFNDVQGDFAATIGYATDHIFGGRTHNPIHMGTISGTDILLQTKTMAEVKELCLALGLGG